MERNRAFILLVLAALVPAACETAAPSSISPAARIATQSVPVNQVEDAAIWIHPTEPAKSLLLVSNKAHGIEIHDFEGTLLKHYEDGKPLAGLDVAYGFPLDGKAVDLAIGACPATTNGGVRVWQIDPAKQRVTEVTEKDVIPVLDGTEPLGIAAYHSQKTNQYYFFVTTEEGKIEQYQLVATADGHVGAKRVRQFELPGKVKAGVADEEAGVIYFALEKTGVYVFDAEPTGAGKGECVIPQHQNNLVGDLTGITLYCGSGSKGYLIVVCQTPKGTQSSLFLYERAAPHKYVLTIQPAVGALGGIYSSSGIAVTNQATTGNFPMGLIAAKNRFNPSATEDYKIYSWEEIAKAGHLVMDPSWSPRGK